MKEQTTGVPSREFQEACRRTAADGMVLLKNENGTLPLTDGERVSVFGRCQIDYYRSGTGSGGSVNVAYSSNLLGALRACGEIRVNEELAKLYEDWVREHPFDNGGGVWAGEPWHQEEMELTEETVRSAAAQSDKAVVVIGRTAGEDQDNAGEEGSFLLTKKELSMLNMVAGCFSRTAVVLNVSNIIDMSWLDTLEHREHIRAVLYSWHGGSEGGNACADVLTGRKAPGGKLTDTIACALADYPSSEEFGGEKENFYREDIYVGYRYFETFAPGRVRFPFGFGLSYTDFEVSAQEVCVRGKGADAELLVRAAVKNAGAERAGREVVQLYAQAPQGRLGKPVKVLADFAKTRLLEPGETETLTLRCALSSLASYDDSGATGNKSCRVLEPGAYEFYLGTDVRTAARICPEGGPLVLEECLVTERLREAMAPVRKFQRLRPLSRGKDECGPAAEEQSGECGPSGQNEAAGQTLKPQGCAEEAGENCGKVEENRGKAEENRGRVEEERGKAEQSAPYRKGWETAPHRTEDLERRIQDSLPQPVKITGDRGLRFQDVREGSAELSAFAAQLTREELAALVRGEGMCSPLVTPGTASAFGGVTPALRRYGIPAACTADGPSGIRMDSGQKATLLPIGTLLASTWDTAEVERLYEFEGEELLQNRIDILLGPGINLHRNPLNGRNFEYYSEDPLIAGRFAAAAVRGIQKSGASAAVKHFACNNQEHGRSTADAVVSERALRELYLKSFEIAVKEGGARAVMTAYNPVNGHWSASNFDLCTTILRGEWGFEGIVMTDWWARMNDPVQGGAAELTNTAAMVRAQNDLYMVVPNGGAAENTHGDNTLEALENGALTLGELQRSAENILRFLLRTPAAERGGVPEEDTEVSFAPIRLWPPCGEGTRAELLQNGRYKFFARVRSMLSEQAQSSCNLLLNGRVAATVQTNGTDGKWTLLKLENVYLEAGSYEFSLEMVKPGMEIDWIEMTR